MSNLNFIFLQLCLVGWQKKVDNEKSNYNLLLIYVALEFDRHHVTSAIIKHEMQK